MMTNRELDKWLAENLMRWKEQQASVWNSSSHMWVGALCWLKKPYPIRVIEWNPTTSISDAFQVAEKMDNCLHLRQHGITGGWVANFCTSTWKEVEADTPELAICLAAKKAIESK